MQTRRLIAFVIVVLGTVIIQWHGIGFWTEHAGTSGIAWSIVLEAAALWLWWHPRLPARLVGAAGTLILLAGPVYHITQPVLGQWQHERATAAELADAIAQERLLRDELARFLDNSGKRSGWLPAIEDTHARLDRTRARIRALRSRTHGAAAWQPVAVAGLTLGALLVIVIAQISAVRALADTPPPRRETAPREPDAPAAEEKAPRQPEDEDARETSAPNEDRARAEELPSPPETTPRQTPAALRVVATRPVRRDEPEDADEIRAWVEELVRKHGSIRQAANAIGMDRREIGCVRRTSGRRPKKETWDALRAIMRAERHSPFMEEDTARADGS